MFRSLGHRNTRRLTVRHKSRHSSRSTSDRLSRNKRTYQFQFTLPDYSLLQLWMAHNSHLNRSAINAIATDPTTEWRDYQHSAFSTTKLQPRQYGMMTQRRRQRLHRLRTTLHTINSRSVLSCRLTGQRKSSPKIVTSQRFDGHLSDMSLFDTLLVVNPSLRHVTRRHVIRHQPIVRDDTTASTLRHGPLNHRQCQVDHFRSPGTDQFVTL